MSQKLEKADGFRTDFAIQALWYLREAGEEVARRFQQAVDSTLQRLCAQPDIG